MAYTIKAPGAACESSAMAVATRAPQERQRALLARSEASSPLGAPQGGLGTSLGELVELAGSLGSTLLLVVTAQELPGARDLRVGLVVAAGGDLHALLLMAAARGLTCTAVARRQTTGRGQNSYTMSVAAVEKS